MAIIDPIEYPTVIRTLDHLAGSYIPVPAAIVQQIGTFNIRLFCTLNGVLTWPCGLVAHGQGDAYITINQERLRKLKLKPGSKVLVQLRPDESEFGLEMPEELQEVLRLDDEGQRRFRALVPGKQRFLIRTVLAVKNTQLRVDRSLQLITRLKQAPEGKETFAQLSLR